MDFSDPAERVCHYAKGYLATVPGDPVLRVVDTRAGGDITRVIISGAPDLEGDTVAARCRDFARRYDHLRRKLIHPPLGALHMCPVLLLPDVADADFGVIIMESMGYPPISGSNLFCATAVALEYGFATMREPETRLRVETPAGVVAVTAACREGRCRSVEFENTPACIQWARAVSIGSETGPVPVTVVSAGVDYAALEALRLDVPLTPASYPRLLELGTAASEAAGTDFALFHGPVERGERDARATIAVFQKPGVICRSPTGTGTSALLALTHARGIVEPGHTLTTRSPRGGEFVGRLLWVRQTPAGDLLGTAVSGRVRIDKELAITG